MIDYLLHRRGLRKDIYLRSNRLKAWRDVTKTMEFELLLQAFDATIHFEAVMEAPVVLQPPPACNSGSEMFKSFQTLLRNLW